ncbi:MAG TPA: M13 family metallopeptidase [Candidatus Angelobacter sp.]|nr:M13 family metallopeptidase [Candidatus Angelobacter sp.]
MQIHKFVMAAWLCCAVAMAEDHTPKLEHFDASQVDRTLDPCNDFFQYSCSKWLKANPIPDELGGYGTFGALGLWNLAAVRETLEKAANASATRSPIEQKVGDYFSSCMNEDAVDKAGLTAIKPMLDRIAGLKSKAQLPSLLAYIHQRVRPADLNFIDAQYQGVVFGIYAAQDFDDASKTVAMVDQSGMNLPAREFYLEKDDKSKQVRDAYVDHIARMLELTGETHKEASTAAPAILGMETAFANAAMDIVRRRDPKNQNNKMTLRQLQALTPSFHWSQYLAAIGAPAASQYLVASPDFFRGLEKVIAATSLDDWRNYLRYTVVHLEAQYLGKPFVEANFDFFGKVLSGAQQIQPRQRRCSAETDADLGEAVGQLYVARYFPSASKASMLELVKGIEAALDQDIRKADWMSETTKKQAREKLAAQIDKIGYPDHWRDYSSLRIERGDFLGNVERAAKYEMDRRLAKIGKPADRQEWGMTPSTVNAYEDAPTNTINFPAGILQPPFFDVSQVAAVNYGAIGAVIGHEIIHGYDDQGRKFDAQGNLRDWWTPQDASNYNERDKCITEEYTQDVPEAGVRQNGELSAGEDTADNGGIHIALGALRAKLQSEGKDLDSPAGADLSNLQTFFLAYANVWCGQLRPEAARTAVMSQGHSLNRYRVNNVVGNMPEFAHAFGCKAGQPMVHAKSCRVW